VRTVYQNPRPAIAIYRPEYDNAVFRQNLVVAYDPYATGPGTVSTGLLAYTFNETVKGIGGSFSFEVTPEMDNKGSTWYEKINKMDLVYIQEAGEIRYVGVIHKKRYSSRMTDKGPVRTISFDGDSIGEMLNRFQLIFDYKLFPTIDAETAGLKLADAINEKEITIKELFTSIYTAFMDITEQYHNTNSGVRTVLDEFISLDRCEDSNVTYLMQNSFYQQNVNTMIGMWQNYLPSPVYEIFGRYNNKVNKLEIIARECPFGDDEFLALDQYTIDPVQVIDYDLSESDDEVYTAFYSYLVGDQFDKSFYMAADGLEGKMVLTDSDKFKMYGFRPLEATFRFYSKSNFKEDANILADMHKKYNEKLCKWYKNIDNMLVGTITIKTDWSGKSYPVVGCRLGWIGAQFYIQDIAHSWAYGTSPSMKITVIRGYQYAGSKTGKIRNVGQALKEFEKQQPEKTTTPRNA